MIRAHASTDGTDQREFETVANELYALRPDAFSAARDAQVSNARTEGRPGLARELSRLRRPTQSAWLVNLLSRDQRDAVEELLQLADDLSRAQSRVARDELQRLNSRRRELEIALLRRARALAEEDGVNVTPSMEREVQDTLAAALANADVANEVRSGRLVKPASYAGFGPALAAVPVEDPQALPNAGDGKNASPSRKRRKPDNLEKQPNALSRKRSDDRERRVGEAAAALEAAARALTDRRRTAEEARRSHQQALQRAEQLREQLGQLEDDVETAGHAAITAARQLDEAEKDHEAAQRALAQAKEQTET